MVKVTDPEIFKILDRVSVILRHRIDEQRELFASL
jgi:hypothetical protein